MNFKLLVMSAAILLLSACSANYENISGVKSVLKKSNPVRVSVHGNQLPQVTDNVKTVDTGRLKIYVMDEDNPYRENVVEEVDMAYRVPVQAKPVRVAHVQNRSAPTRRVAMNSQYEAQRRIANLRKVPQKTAPKRVVKPVAQTNKYRASAASKVREIPAVQKAWKLPSYDKASQPVINNKVQVARRLPIKQSNAPQKQWRKPAYNPPKPNNNRVVKYKVPTSAPENADQKARRLKAEQAVRELKESQGVYRKAQRSVSKTKRKSRSKRRRGKRVYNTMPNPGLKTKPKSRPRKYKSNTKRKGAKKPKGKWKWDKNGEIIRS